MQPSELHQRRCLFFTVFVQDSQQVIGRLRNAGGRVGPIEQLDIAANSTWDAMDSAESPLHAKVSDDALRRLPSRP